MASWNDEARRLSQATQDEIVRLADAMRAHTAAELFANLCQYSRVHYTYKSSPMFGEAGAGFETCLKMGLFDCGAISRLMTLLWLYGQPHDVNQHATIQGIHGGATPVLSPSIRNPGIRIQPNVRNGPGPAEVSDRMVFDNHWVANLAGQSYDVIAGISGAGELGYLACDRTAGGLSIRIGATAHTLAPIGGYTGNELREYRATPALPPA